MEWHQAFMGTMVKPIILPGQEIASTSKNVVSFDWRAVPEHSGKKSIGFNFRITCNCSKGYFYETTYSFYVDEQRTGIVMGVDEVAPATYLANRWVKRLPYWKIGFINRLSRLPVIGKKFKQIWF